MSAVRLLMMAFWTWLWGPYRPRSCHASDSLPGRPRQIYSADGVHHRLLARDQDEAAHIVAEYLTKHPRERLYYEVLVPALNYAKLERERGSLTDADE